MEIGREKKRVIIIAIYVAIFLTIVSALWFFLKPVQTCDDGKQNQNEKGVDCGGVCTPCEETTGRDLIITESAVIFGGNGTWDVLVKIKNPNNNIGSPEFTYNIELVDASGVILAQKRGSSYILPAETRTIIEMGISLNGQNVPSQARVTIVDSSWKLLKDLDKPDISIFNKSVEAKQGVAGTSVYAILRNESSYDLNKVDVSVVLRGSDGKAIGLSKTNKDTMRANEERDFKLTWPYQLAGDVAQVEVDATVNMYDPSNILDASYQKNKNPDYR